jgi:capsid protein
MNFLKKVLGGKRPDNVMGLGRTRAVAHYLRDTGSRILSSRSPALLDHREDVSRAWSRAAALTIDIIQNSGLLKGACDQIIADTVGNELLLNPQPRLENLGYNNEERASLIKLIKEEFKLYAWNPKECDVRGKFTLPQLADVALRHYLSYGEIVGMIDWMPAAKRAKYGVRYGTKFCLVPPTKLVQDTNESQGLFQGVYHDDHGRPTAYLFEEKKAGLSCKVQHSAFTRNGSKSILHIFDPVCATDVRGISAFVPAIRTHLLREKLVDVTLQTSILQTMIAIVLSSEKPSMQAFEALEALKDVELPIHIINGRCDVGWS